MSQPRLILGSGSPQRNKLMQQAGYAFDVVVPDDSAESGICSNCGPATLVTDLALRKAANVAQKLAPEGTDAVPTLIVACDTVAEINGTILGKPRDEDHARTMLSQLSDSVHRVYSGLCLWPLGIPTPVRPIETEVAITELRMDRLSEEDLDAYLETGMWRGKAGAFGLQDGPDWVHVTNGSESNVIGLPMEQLAQMLKPWAIGPGNRV